MRVSSRVRSGCGVDVNFLPIFDPELSPTEGYVTGGAHRTVVLSNVVFGCFKRVRVLLHEPCTIGGALLSRGFPQPWTRRGLRSRRRARCSLRAADRQSTSANA